MPDLATLDGERVLLERRVQPDINATATHAPDGLAFRADTGEPVDATTVTAIIERRRARGAAEGALIGALIAGTGAATIGYLSGDNECTSDCVLRLTATDKVLGGVLFGALGGVLGALVGLARGSLYVYSTTSAPTPRPVAGAPSALTWMF